MNRNSSRDLKSLFLNPEGPSPSIQCLGHWVPKAMLFVAFRAGNLKYFLLEPSGAQIEIEQLKEVCCFSAVPHPYHLLIKPRQ